MTELLWVTQESYVGKALKHFNIQVVKRVITPFVGRYNRLIWHGELAWKRSNCPVLHLLLLMVGGIVLGFSLSHAAERMYTANLCTHCDTVKLALLISWVGQMSGCVLEKVAQVVWQCPGFGDPGHARNLKSGHSLSCYVICFRGLCSEFEGAVMRHNSFVDNRGQTHSNNGTGKSRTVMSIT